MSQTHEDHPAASSTVMPGDGCDTTSMLKAVIESVHDGILIVSPEGRMVHTNQNFLEIWNFPPEILASRSDEAALVWAANQTVDPGGFLERVASVYRGPKENVREEVAMKDGRTYERCGSPVRNASGELGWLWTFRDITNRKQTEEELRRSEVRYRTLFDSIDEGFCIIEMIFDSEGKPCDYRFIEMNPAFEKHTGMTGAKGRTMKEFAPNHEQHWFDIYGRIALTGEPQRSENHAIALNRWFEVYGFRVGEPEERRVGVIFSDVTQRKEAMNALHVSEEFSRTVIESSPDCIKIMDTEGRLQYMNRSGQALKEIDDFEAYANVPVWTYWGPHNEAIIRDAVARAARGESVHFQACCKTPRGAEKWWDVVIAPVTMTQEGAPTERLIAVSRDITQAKRAEEAMRVAKEEAESASRAKDNFLAALSHELRTPLTPVLMSATALRDDESIPAHAREQMGMIARNVALEARLIDDLLDLTRITHGKLTLRAEPCDLHALIHHVVEIVGEEAQVKKIAVKLQLSATRRGLVGDPVRLQQVFWNLLRNAVKFSPTGATVRVISRDLDAPDGTGGAVFEVADDGIGIEPSALQRIFEPFEQATSGREHRFGGLGLGLAIARAIVDLHQGAIRAHSPGKGGGSVFTVELPADEVTATAGGEAAGSAAGAEAAAALAGEPHLRLLVVEDHDATLQVLTRLLSRFGHEVVTATSLATAFAAAEAQTFDAVISDLGLPDGTGLELMSELRARYGLSGVVLSGYGMEEDLRRSREVGFVAHLVKPVDIEELRRVIRQFAPPRGKG